MNKFQIVNKAYDLEKKWKNFRKLRTKYQDIGKIKIEEEDDYLSSAQRERILEDFIYLFWLLTAKCFKHDEELKKIEFFANRCKRLDK